MGKNRNFAARRGALTAALLAAPAALGAQTTNTAAPTTVTVPTLDHYSLPSGANQQTPQPTPTPTSTPSATPHAVTPPPVRVTLPRPTPTATAKPAPKPAANPVRHPVAPTATPTPTPQPTHALNALPTPVPTTAAPTTVAPPVVVASPAPPPSGSGTRQWLGWGALIAAVLVLFAGFGWPGLRRRLLSRRARSDDTLLLDEPVLPPVAPPEPVARESAPPSPPAPVPQPKPVAPPSAPPASTAGDSGIEIRFRAKRAGMNLTGAAVEYALELANMRVGALSEVRVDIRMLTASEQQEATLAAIFAAPIDRPSVAPFELAAGTNVELGGMTILPREALTILTMQERQFFVPMVAIRVLGTAADGATVEATSVQVVGIDRGPDAKMAPFRTDQPPRMFDKVTQRPHLRRG